MPVALALVGLGLVIGGLMPAPAYRLSVPAGQPPRAACASCGTALPVGPAGWVRARCAACRTRLGPPRWLTVTVGAVVFGSLGWALRPSPALAAFLVVAGFGVLLGAIDVACHRLPDPLVFTAFGIASAVLVTASLLDGRVGPLVRAGLGALVMFGGYLLLGLLPRAALGFGDVKLAGLLGLVLGWLGWPVLVFGALLPHLLNGPVALGLLVSGRARRDTQLPLGPALLAGAWLAVVAAGAWMNRYRG